MASRVVRSCKRTTWIRRESRSIAGTTTLALLLVTTGGMAQASLITIDSAGYSIGTDISTASGAAFFSTFSNAGGNGGQFAPVVIVPGQYEDIAAPHAFDHLPGYGVNHDTSATWGVSISSMTFRDVPEPQTGGLPAAAGSLRRLHGRGGSAPDGAWLPFV